MVVPCCILFKGGPAVNVACTRNASKVFDAAYQQSGGAIWWRGKSPSPGTAQVRWLPAWEPMCQFSIVFLEAIQTGNMTFIVIHVHVFSPSPHFEQYPICCVGLDEIVYLGGTAGNNASHHEHVSIPADPGRDWFWIRMDL